MVEWTTACPDWERRIVAGESIVPCPPLFPTEAADALEYFKAFKVVDVAGTPTVGKLARPWIIDFASAFFGSYDPTTGKRHIRTFYLKVPKKNWKSGITSFLMGTLLLRNWRESGEFGIIAPTTEIANNAFGPLKHAIRRDEELSDLLHVQDHVRTITHRTTKSSLQVVAAESDTVGGKKFIVTLVEELWLFGKRANAEAMLLEATGGMASRDEGAVIYITTESDEAPSGVYLAKNIYARKVRDGVVNDPSFMPVLYEWPTSMVASKACLELENAKLVNPNLGASVSGDWLRSKYAEAKEESAQAFQAFVAKHLNVEVGVSLRSDRWAGADYWQDRADPTLAELDALLRRCDVATVGIDGGGLDDLLALAVIGREIETGNWLVWAKAWAHPSVLERRKSEAARLRDFERDGDLVIVERIGDDVDELAALVAIVAQSGLLERPERQRGAIGVDPVGIGAIVDGLIDQGIDLEQIVAVSQGWRLAGAIKTTERKLAEGAMYHAGTPLMSWAVGNAKVEPRGNAIMITKQASGTAKIDPLMALFDAAHLMSLVPQSIESIFNTMTEADFA